MAGVSENYSGYSTEDLQELTVRQLKQILESFHESTSGKKASLVSRAYAYICRVNKSDNDDPEVNKVKLKGKVEINIPKECMFKDLTVLAGDAVWTTDLRKLPEVNFHQLYDYLVVKTQKFGENIMKGSVYKKERSFNFYSEGHISEMKVCVNDSITLVKAKVMASMKKIKYNVVVVYNEHADVLYAACECPAGLGPNGEGKCNHTGGLLFCVEDFSRKRLQKAPEVVTCTGKLSSWNVPRDLKVSSAELPNMKIKKVVHGKRQETLPSVTLYDPRAPVDRFVDVPALRTLYDDLEDCMPASGFFLFHDDPKEIQHEEISQEESIHVSEIVEVASTINECENDSTKNVLSDQKLLDMCLINDVKVPENIDIDCEAMESAVNDYVEKLKVDSSTIEAIETRTKEQSNCKLWHDLHKTMLTASNFGRVIKCKKNPDSVIKQLLYTNFSSVAMQYGKDNEDNAIRAYVQTMKDSGKNVEVEKMGLLICEKVPALGASVDGKIYDQSTDSYGCLEVKCPMSRAGLTLMESVQKKPFCLIKDQDQIRLNKTHDYYYQVQGQMYVTGLKWTDFVVWLSDEQVHIERIMFDESSWHNIWMPRLIKFYKKVFIPELLTRRVQQGLRLYKEGQYACL